MPFAHNLAEYKELVVRAFLAAGFDRDFIRGELFALNPKAVEAFRRQLSPSLAEPDALLLKKTLANARRRLRGRPEVG